MIPAEVVYRTREEIIRNLPSWRMASGRKELTRMMKPNERDGRRRATHFSMSGRRMLKRGLERAGVGSALFRIQQLEGKVVVLTR